MLTDLGKTQRHRIEDQLTEHATASWQHADLGAGVLVNANRDEPLQLRAGAIQHAERRVPRARQLAR